MWIIIGFIISAGLILIDQLSKIIIKGNFELGVPVTVIPKVVDIYPIFNRGAAFSILTEHPWILVASSIIGALVVGYLMKDFSLKRRKLYSISIVLIFSGTVGNLIDRIYYGISESVVKVFDFIEPTFIDFATFNGADSYLTIGVILLCIYILFFESKDPIKLFKRKKATTDVLEEETSVENEQQ